MDSRVYNSGTAVRKTSKSVMSGSNKHEGAVMISRSGESTLLDYERSVMTDAHGGCNR